MPSSKRRSQGLLIFMLAHLEQVEAMLASIRGRAFIQFEEVYNVSIISNDRRLCRYFLSFFLFDVGSSGLSQ
jgi:hypothetical protein